MKNLLAVACALLALPAAAQNHQPYPIGERATGLGGAYTALAEDEAGAYYNPAGPAFTGGNSLSVSTSFYGLAFGRLENGLGGGNDFRYSTLNLLPINASSLWHFGTPRAEGRAAPWVVAFSVFAPSTLSVDTRNDVRDGAVNFFLNASEKNLHVGPTLAYRFERLALGASLFALVQTQTDRLDYTAIVPSGVEGRNNFAQLTVSREQFNVGLCGSLGARYQATPSWSFGAAVRSPSLQLYGKGSQYTRLLFSNAEENMGSGASSTDEVLTAALLPLRASLGVAYTRPKDLTLSLDATFYAPIEYVAYHAVSTAAADVVRRFHAVADVAFGVEKYVTASVPLRAGLFTDLSGTADPDPNSDSSDDQVHRFGATLTVGMETEHSSTTVGVVGTFAAVKSIGYDIGNSFDAFPVQGTQYTLFFVLSSSYVY